eukprot:TRINITY_DN16486_c0_g1_i1.p1 TRINITY_DN16486_c0_g1~~TRINITY_DN16486_c0_g1_i1.p1  ORF type:complete len:558 (+),score=149.26 TRINITY_DN16486_c0_g1_i1:33-1676(+)
MQRPKSRLLYRKKWRRLARKEVPYDISEGLRYCLEECTLEFDHGIRHRLHGRSPRALGWPLLQGSWDSSFPVVHGKPLPEITASLPCERSAKGWTFVAMESKSSYQSMMQYKVHRAISGASRSLVIQRHGNLAQTWGVVLMLPDNTTHRFVARGLLTLNSEETKVNILQASNKYLMWPTSVTQHTAFFELLRKPLYGSVQKLADKVARTGFVNYYALPNTRRQIAPSLIGAAILQKDWKAATTFLLSRMAMQTGFKRKAHALWTQGAGEDVLRSFFCKQDSETAASTMFYVYQPISGPENERDYALAFNNVPNFHKYESLLFVQQNIWNYMTSMRLSIYGTSVVPGDLVMDAAGAVYHVTEDNKAGFSIYDVVMPVYQFPCREMKYPTHACSASLVEEVLSDFGVSMSELVADKELNQMLNKIMRNEREQPLQEYRHIIVKPAQLSCVVTDKPLPHIEAGSFDIPNLVHPDHTKQYVVLKAQIPSTSDMESLTREILMTGPPRPTPVTWRMSPLRMGSVIHPDDEKLEEELEAMERLAQHPSKVQGI